LSVAAPPTIRGVALFLAHTPGLVRYGSKPARELGRDPALIDAITRHLRPWEAAAAYPPNHAFLGGVDPLDLAKLPRPWWQAAGTPLRWHPHGEIMPEEEFYGLLKLSDGFDLVTLEESFAREAAEALAGHRDLTAGEAAKIGSGRPLPAIEAEAREGGRALPLHLRSGRLIGSMARGHEEDTVLTADVLLENLACKVAASMAMRRLLRSTGVEPGAIDYVINCGEEAIGDRYQRGGGNLAKAVAESCGCLAATGSDVKAFCCGPVHALVMAGALVAAGVYRNVAVVAGCSLAKLGMKFQGHLAKEQPILEDVLAGAAVLVSGDDGHSPVIRLDSVGRHPVGAGGAQRQILEALVAEPLSRLGLRFGDVDRYATELHNPEVTEPAGSGNVPLLNYRMIAALAVAAGEVARAGLDGFVEAHGMPGFSPTQGHIASAIPFLGHAHEGLTTGRLRRVMFLAKGSLFLGRMTQMSDGLSFILEANPASQGGRA
jgi:glycine/sarcosine/betaine reductase complex component C subunit beta